MTFSQFLSILKARWVSALAVLLLTVGTAVGISLILPKQYTATAAVVVDVKSPDPIAGMVLGAMAMPSYMATQVDIITSSRVAQQVVRTLKLTENADLREQWLDETQGQGNFEAWVADLLSKKLDVKPSRESNVINVGYTAPDPRFAAALANAYVQAYMTTSLDLRVAPAKQYASFFENQSKDLRVALETAQSKLSDYQRAHGILVTDERLDVETQRLNELSSQLVAIQALSAESRSRSAQARSSSADQLQDVINNPVVAGLRADLSRQQAKLEELNARLGEAHPQVRELKANIDELRQRIDAETKRVSGSMGINNTINSSREGELRGALEAQRNKVAKMKEQRDEAAVYIKDVEAAQRAFDAVSQRLTQTSLESQTNQTNVSVLTPATEPAEHSSPRLLLNTLVAIFLGSLLSIGIALLRELMDRRVRSAGDLTEALGVPLLGTLPKPLRASSSGGITTLVLPSNLLGRLPGPNR